MRAAGMTSLSCHKSLQALAKIVGSYFLRRTAVTVDFGFVELRVLLDRFHEIGQAAEATERKLELGLSEIEKEIAGRRSAKPGIEPGQGNAYILKNRSDRGRGSRQKPRYGSNAQYVSPSDVVFWLSR
jgi:hypothetical protein